VLVRQVRLGASFVDVDVLLNVRMGEVDMYVSDSYENKPEWTQERGVFNYTLSSTQQGSDRLLIQHSHFQDCADACYYVVGVFGRGAVRNDYSIVAKKVDTTVTLLDGVRRGERRAGVAEGDGSGASLTFHVLTIRCRSVGLWGRGSTSTTALRWWTPRPTSASRSRPSGENVYLIVAGR
jgi:hypothetical protein